MRGSSRHPTLTRRAPAQQRESGGLTNRQKVKVNAALSAIYAEGYDAQAVVNWARDYMSAGMAPATAYQHAINEFARAQPAALHNQLVKMNRLIEASDDQTLARYDDAFSTYIASGDTSKLTALAPMVAQDAVALAARNGEIPHGAVTAEAVEAALGVRMGDDVINAAQPAPERFNFSAPAQAGDAYLPAERAMPSSQVSPYPAEGRMAQREKWEAVHNPAAVNGGRARTLTEGRVINPAYDGAFGEAV